MTEGTVTLEDLRQRVTDIDRALIALVAERKAVSEEVARVKRATGKPTRDYEREREVIEMRFGLTGERPYTLEEVGRAFNVTRERIRQIENHTLKKLEALPEAQRLRDASYNRA